jgi:hypothetical protein
MKRQCCGSVNTFFVSFSIIFRRRRQRRRKRRSRQSTRVTCATSPSCLRSPLCGDIWRGNTVLTSSATRRAATRLSPSSIRCEDISCCKSVLWILNDLFRIRILTVHKCWGSGSASFGPLGSICQRYGSGSVSGSGSGSFPFPIKVLSGLKDCLQIKF